MKTGIVIDERYMAHETGHWHPERPERIGALLEMLRTRPVGEIVRMDPRPATLEEIALNHDPAHIARVAATEGRDWFAFDADTPTSSRSYETALLAAGGVVTLVDAIMEGVVGNGFALIRPPGHHAESDRAMGFCLFNNIAVAARVLRERHGLERVLIMDWDLHHGNGTQHSFYEDPSVLYLSTHQYPYYPGTGAAEDTGRGAGVSFNVNIPLAAGSGDSEFVEVFTHVVQPIALQFSPQFVLISAGFDCHRRDPLGGLTATEAGIAYMTSALMRCAEECAEGRVAAVLEGGYDLLAISSSVSRVLDRLTRTEPAETPPSVVAGPTTERVRRVQRQYWEI